MSEDIVKKAMSKIKKENRDFVAIVKENADLKADNEMLMEAIEGLLEFAKSFEKKAWDAWKPVQMFRSDNEVELDEIKRELLDEINEEAKAVVQDAEELLNPSNAKN